MVDSAHRVSGRVKESASGRGPDLARARERKEQVMKDKSYEKFGIFYRKRENGERGYRKRKIIGGIRGIAMILCTVIWGTLLQGQTTSFTDTYTGQGSGS